MMQKMSHIVHNTDIQSEREDREERQRNQSVCKEICLLRILIY